MDEEYYDGITDGAKKGKLKSFGKIGIDYHDNFSPAAKSGKIKSIKGNTPDLYVIIDRGNRMYSDTDD